MSHSRRHKPHHCKNHPRVVARGKCGACGAWVCRQCAVLVNGRFSCADTCARKTPEPAARPPEPRPAPLEPATPRPAAPRLAVTPTHAAIAAATFGLCCLALMLWTLRENAALREEVGRLRDQRMGLIENTRESNREIATLRDSLSAEPSETPRTPGGKVRQQALVQRDAIETPLGLPVSFDNGPRDKPLVALTFDGGSHDNAVQDILDTLASRGVPATMFLSGEFIRRFPEAVLRIAGAGHEIGNHMTTHPHLTTWERDQTHATLPGVDATMVARELRSAGDAFRKLTGRDFSPIWRAPYGEKNRQICLWAQAAGYLHVGWRQGRSWRETLDSNDWIPNEEASGYHAPAEVLDKILSIAESPGGLNGGIILLHLGTVRKDPASQVHRILGTMIDRLRERGYRCVTVSEMLAEGGIDASALRRVAPSPPERPAEDR